MFVRVNGLDLHVVVEGPPGAPALLLLHSLGTTQAIWEAPARAFAGAFRVIRPDLRGHGLTGVGDAPGSMALFAADAIGLLDALGVEAAHVAGISLGGLVAQAIAAAAPERVRSLVLCDTALSLPPPESWRERAAAVRAGGMEPLVETVIARWLTPGALQSPAASGLREMLRRTSPAGYAAAAEAIAAADFTASSAAIGVPTLVLVGEQDPVTDVATARRLAATIPDARLAIIPDASHIPTMERADEVVAAMRDALMPVVGDAYEAGMTVRRQVLGEAHVARATASITEFDRDFQAFITRTAWGGVWTRPTLDRRTRSLVTLAMMASLGHEEEFALHIRASRNTGATAADISDLMIQVAAYAGIPAANAAVRVAKRVFAEMAAES